MRALRDLQEGWKRRVSALFVFLIRHAIFVSDWHSTYKLKSVELRVLSDDRGALICSIVARCGWACPAWSDCTRRPSLGLCSL